MFGLSVNALLALIAVVVLLVVVGASVHVIRSRRQQPQKKDEYPSFRGHLTDLPTTEHGPDPLRDFWRLLGHNEYLRAGGRLSTRSGFRITVTRPSADMTVIVVAAKRDAERVQRYVGRQGQRPLTAVEDRRPSPDSHISQEQAADATCDDMVAVKDNELEVLGELLGAVYPTPTGSHYI